MGATLLAITIVCGVIFILSWLVSIWGEGQITPSITAGTVVTIACWPYVLPLAIITLVLTVLALIVGIMILDDR